MGEIFNTKEKELNDAYAALGEVEETDQEVFAEEYSTESLESQFETGKIDGQKYDELAAERSQQV